MEIRSLKVREIEGHSFADFLRKENENLEESKPLFSILYYQALASSVQKYQRQDPQKTPIPFKTLFYDSQGKLVIKQVILPAQNTDKLF